ncbi:hypothetical protein AX15_001308 [Amanita polypyramis BW_CC]|nr:hypothetical protein AX15_001308 [Amanita polypyramis BW_CC]
MFSHIRQPVDLDLPHGTRPATPLANLSKAVASQRGQTASPAPRSSSTGKKLSLEDRLASLTTGDLPGTNSSKRPTQSISNSQRATPIPSSPTTKPDPPNDASSPPRMYPLISPSLIPLPDSSPPSPVSDKLPENIMTDNMTRESGEERRMGPPTSSAVQQSNLEDIGPHAGQDIESLQERLKQVEQRFLDVSESFKNLQANRTAADAVFQELTPLQTIQDAGALRDYLKAVISKSSNEIKELESKVQEQEQRILELSSKHNLESQSQSEVVERLSSQITEAEALFKASQQASCKVQESVHKQKEEMQKLQADLERAKNVAKEEEEKRVKAISLLKTVRQKLVKTERERDETLKEAALLKQREQEDKDKEQADKIRLQEELNVAKADKEKASTKTKAQFEKELAGLKERYEKELSVLKGQFELESVTLKASHTKELSLKASQVATLEASLNNTARDKNQMFDQLQMRQAEVESAQSHLESLQNQNTELQYQLREAQDRTALLACDLQEAQREQETRSHPTSISSEEVARLLSSTELKYEQKLTEIRMQLRQTEFERNDIEMEWNRKVHDKAKEVENLKNLLEASSSFRGECEGLLNSLRAENAHLQEEVRLNQQKLTELLSAKELVESFEKTAKEQEVEFTNKIRSFEQQIKEAAARETQLRLSNKTLREELRKVQSSIALLERQRVPGIGYWASSLDESTPAEPRKSVSSIQSESPSRPGSPTPVIQTSSAKNEEINLEYLRNVILQFLEHKEMRPNLVRVISILLRFTPQETRRLMARV